VEQQWVMEYFKGSVANLASLLEIGKSAFIKGLNWCALRKYNSKMTAV
jgi:hypothetical protein